MAEKLSNSIRRRVKGLKKALESPPKEDPAAKGNSGSSGAPAKTSDQAGSADSAATPATKPDKKKALSQPWYRHRQRW